MTIKYADGRHSEAVLLFRTNHAMRVVLKGSDDATDFTEVDGAWISEKSEPVQVEFVRRTEVPSVSDCVCSPELASRLIDLLFAGSQAAQSKVPPRHFTSACC